MDSSVLCEGEAYQIESLPITNRVALQRRDFVGIAGLEEWQHASDLRRKESKFLDLEANTGKNQD